MKTSRFQLSGIDFEVNDDATDTVQVIMIKDGIQTSQSIERAKLQEFLGAFTMKPVEVVIEPDIEVSPACRVDLIEKALELFSRDERVEMAIVKMVLRTPSVRMLKVIHDNYCDLPLKDRI